MGTGTCLQKRLAVHYVAMEWFTGTTGEAVAKAKAGNAVFGVCIYGM
jgi:hypothetical protein